MTDVLYTIGAETKGVKEAEGSLDRLEKSVLDNIKAVEKFERDHKKLDDAFNKGKISAQQYSLGHQQLTQQLTQTTSASERQAQALERTAAVMQRGQRVTLQTGSAQQALRQRFLETANSIAVLDGPLGGVASRFSAFGVLVGRTGVILAGTLTVFAAFGFALRSGVAEATEYERAMARINAILETTGSQVGLTSSQIDGLAESIALSSLQSSQAVREAVGQLLTFGNVAGEVFPEVLRLAADMAALGFGTLQSESTKLAKAIEDPRQSLTSLSRSGITFTRDQRAVILSLVETGREAEATARILEAVRNQVGGAASREAETFSGKIDTITQAYGRLFRQLGEFTIREEGLLGRAITGVADRAAQFVEQRTPLFSGEDIRREQEQLRQTELILQDAQRRLQALNQEFSQAGFFESFKIASQIAEVSSEIQGLFRDIEQSKTLIGDGIIENIPETTRAVGRLNDAILELELSVGEAIRDTGVSSLEAYVNAAERGARATGLVGEEVESLNQELRNLATIEFVVKQSAALENNLRRATDAFQDQNAAAQAQLEFIGKTGREAQILRSIREQQLRVENDILALEQQKTNATEEQIANIEKQQQGLRDQLDAYMDAAEQARQVAAASDDIEAAQRAAADEATRFSSIINGSQSIIDAAKSRVVGLAAEVEALANGADRYAANIARGLALQRAANRESVAGIEDPAQRIAATAELAIQQAELNRILNEEANLLRQRDEILSGGGSGRSGGGGGAEKRLEQLQKEIEAMQMRLDLTQDFMAAEFQQQEEFYQNQQALLDEALNSRVVTYEEHYRLQELLKEEHERKMADLARQYRMAEIGGFSDFMGSMASIAQAGGSRLEKISRAFAAAQAISKAFQMAVGAGADTPGPIWVRLAAYASALSTGLGAVAAIRGGRTSASGSTAVSRSAAEVAVPSSQTQMAPQRVLIQGLDPNALFTGEQIQNLFESLYNENENRGRVFVVQT